MPLIEPSNVCMLSPRDKKVLQKTSVKSLEGRIGYYDDVALAQGYIGDIARKAMRRLAPKGKSCGSMCT